LLLHFFLNDSSNPDMGLVPRYIAPEGGFMRASHIWSAPLQIILAMAKIEAGESYAGRKKLVLNETQRQELARRSKSLGVRAGLTRRKASIKPPRMDATTPTGRALRWLEDYTRSRDL
jgi:hypothetical protein